MTRWDPDQYLRYARPRLRPALDLLARIDVDEPEVIVAAGCGPGNLTPYLQRRWPSARIIGVDASPEMLASAQSGHPDHEWVHADLGSWQPENRVDVVYSNATIHWLDDHETVIQRLAGWVRPGGCLAIQMPDNHHAPTHTAITDTVEAGPWADRLRPLLRKRPVAQVDEYRGWLLGSLERLDLWRTEYLHTLDGQDPVAEWTKGSVLRPLLDPLAEPERSEFFEEYARRVTVAYPPEPDGSTLLAFRRLFIVAYAPD